MGHPIMFDNADPLLGRVRELALALPGAAEKVSHGRPAFFTKKIFAYYGGSTRIDGRWVEHAHAVLVLPDADERDALLADPATWVPAYLGAYGWLGVDLPGADTDWALVGELLDASYRNTAPARLVASLDSAASG